MQVHGVASWDEETHAVYIITAYIPDEDHFQEDSEEINRSISFINEELITVMASS